MQKKAKRGRPPFKPTAAMRRRVMVRVGGGMSHESIAMSLDISRETLEKYFSDELARGAAKIRAELLDALHKAAVSGNVSAARAYASLTPTLVAEDAPARPPEQPAPLIGTEGKKERQQREAQTAAIGTAWEGLVDPITPLQ